MSNLECCTMNIVMNTNYIKSIKDIEEFLNGMRKTELKSSASKKEKYLFISDTLVKLKYSQARKKEKGIIKAYLKEITGYSEAQIKRLMENGKNGNSLKKSQIRLIPF